jgi:hypothetical protein
MESELTGVLGVMIPIIAIIGVFTMVVYLRRYENAERMAMIERGVDPTLFAKKHRGSTSGPLRAALLLMGGGVGLLLGYLLEASTDMRAPLPYFAMLFICGGIGLGIAYMVEERKLREEQKKD